MKPDQPTSRREFLVRAGQAAAAVAATGLVTYFARDEAGPRPAGTASAAALPDFSVRGLEGRMSIAAGADRAKTVRRAISALGGIGLFIRPGDRVLLKVNAAFSTPPSISATTHPDLVAEVARLCLGAGASSVVVTDHPINDPASCFELTGLAAAARSAGADVAIPRESDFEPRTLPLGRLIVNWPVLTGPLAGTHKLIGIAPVKDHYRAGASMSLKNWYGLLGGRRNVFHQNIHEIVKELALLVKPTLVILDGTVSMMTNGPTGGSLSDLKPTNTMIVSTDPVAADAFGATLLGRQPADIPYIPMAAVAGAGTANFDLLNPIRVNGT